MDKLAQDALQSLLAQQPLAITHPAGWVRDGFPLPLKRMKPDAAGAVTQDYRPLAVLEHINDVLSGAAAARRLKLTARPQEDK